MVFNAFKSGILPLQPIKGRDNPGMLAWAAGVSDYSHLKVLSKRFKGCQ